ncbi:uncharacterized protein [Drosophila bipectinata]|uniref:uncharacterized protein n=1 Tax=Drosophila bipectinata TaxID=42026 RepID=UPI0038B36777
MDKRRAFGQAEKSSGEEVKQEISDNQSTPRGSLTESGCTVEPNTTASTDKRKAVFQTCGVAMAGVGTLEPFDLLTPGKWKAYRDRFELYLLANGIMDKDRKKAAFLTLAGAPLYELLVSLASPRQVSDLELTEVYDILTSHLVPRQSEIAAFYHFHKRDQQPDESVGNYMATLRSLAVGCNFGQMLDRMLRDRFVCGMRDEGLQRSLLADPELTVQRAMERAVTSEAAAASALSIRGDNIRRLESSSTESIHGISSSCAGCGGRHVRKKCPFRNATCHSCGRTGHIRRVCGSNSQAGSAKSSSPTPSNMRNNRPSHGRVHQIVPVVSPKKSVAVVINGRSCQFEVDSGSPVTIMKESSYRYIWPNGNPDLVKCHLKLSDYQRNPIPVKGITDTSIHYNNRRICNLPLVVTSGTGTNLLGCNWFEPLGIRIEGIHGVQCGNGIAEILRKFDHLFSSELGRYTGPPVALKVDQEVPPVRLPPRRIPYALLKPYEEYAIR